MRAFFQRYGKIVLAIMGVVLMFAFALPTFRGMSREDYSRMAVGYLAGKKVTNDDMAIAQAQYNRLMGLQLFEINRYSLAWQATQAFGGDDQEKGRYWYLLKAEASKYTASSVSDAEISQIMDVLGLTDEVLNRTYNGVQGRKYLAADVSDLDLVETYLQMIVDQPKSAAAVELAADRELRKVQITFVGLDGTQDWEKSPDPTDEQERRQFDLYRGALRTPILPDDADAPAPLPPEIGGHHYPFGYKYPDRVAAEFLELNRAKIKAGMAELPADTDAAYAYYMTHPDEFKVAASQPVVQAPGAPAAPPTQPGIKPWEEVRKDLVNKQIDQRVDRQIKAMREQILSKAGVPWKKGGEVDRADWVSYPQIAEEIAKNPSFGGYKPEYRDTGKELLSAEDLKNIEGIGRASYVIPEQAIVFPFPLLATSVKELVKLDTKTPLGRMDLQVGAEAPGNGQVIKDADGNEYIFRVTRVDPTHEPKTLDEVKAQVIEDCRKKTAYENRVKEIKDAWAKTPDVSEVARQFNSLSAVKTPKPFTQMDRALPAEISGIRDIVKTAFALTQQPATRSATMPDARVTSTTLESDTSLRCYVVQLDKVMPATGKDFADNLRQLYFEPDAATTAFVRSYLDLEALAGRLKYKPVTPFSRRK